MKVKQVQLHKEWMTRVECVKTKSDVYLDIQIIDGLIYSKKAKENTFIYYAH